MNNPFDKMEFEKYPDYNSTLFHLVQLFAGLVRWIFGINWWRSLFPTKENIYWILFDFDDYANAQPQTEGFFDGLWSQNLE